MKRMNKPKKRESFHSNRIPLPFEKIVEGMLAVKPKKKTSRRKKPGKK